MKTRLVVNSSRLLKKIVEEEWILGEVAKALKTTRSTISQLLQRDRRITYRIAGALRRVFGDDVIKVLPQNETIALTAEHPIATTVKSDGTGITYSLSKPAEETPATDGGATHE